MRASKAGEGSPKARKKQKRKKTKGKKEKTSAQVQGPPAAEEQVCGNAAGRSKQPRTHCLDARRRELHVPCLGLLVGTDTRNSQTNHSRQKHRVLGGYLPMGRRERV